MVKIDNKQGIKQITMRPSVITKCKIGGDWFKNNLVIIFEPNKYYPDYMEVNDWLMENIDGQDMNIEEVVDAVHSMLEEEFHPYYLWVTDNVEGCKTHFDVTVEK